LPPPKKGEGIRRISVIKGGGRERFSSEMMYSASIVRQRLCRFSGPIVNPDKGSGPLGCPETQNGRWITACDLLSSNRVVKDLPAPSWDYLLDSTTTKMDFAIGEELPLRDYQVKAATRFTEKLSMKSGILEMGCGLGKTHVAMKLLKTSSCKSIVVTQHLISVEQWITHLKGSVSSSVCSPKNMKEMGWKFDEPLPDVMVLTYALVVRALNSVEDTFEKKLILLLFCEPFGLLIMDECHLAAANQSIVVSKMNFRSVVGLSGSLVREDERLSFLFDCVGPVLFSFSAVRSTQVDAFRCKIDVPDVEEDAKTWRRRSKAEEALRALSPNKFFSLVKFLNQNSEGERKRCIIFCDSVWAARCLNEVFSSCSILISGFVSDEMKRDAVSSFRESEASSLHLISTNVGDAAIDFPQDAIVIQYHISSGSRMQDVQRRGRGTRSLSSESRVVYFFNEGTEEERFFIKRVDNINLKTVHEVHWEGNDHRAMQVLKSKFLDVNVEGKKRKRSFLKKI
jgi:superfamily II DNA or RNA helicase